MDEAYDFRAQRLHVTSDLEEGAEIALSREQSNYLVNVLRLSDGAAVHVFNGRDGEWRALLVRKGRRDAALEVERQTRPQSGGPDLHYLFAPLKRSRLDYMVQKATEMGAARLVPVITRHTVAERVNLDRMRANVIEAAERSRSRWLAFSAIGTPGGSSFSATRPRRSRIRFEPCRRWSPAPWLC
jgi:16S rRNA (uracil1498-N3)-methyltransferase